MRIKAAVGGIGRRVTNGWVTKVKGNINQKRKQFQKSKAKKKKH